MTFVPATGKRKSGEDGGVGVVKKLKADTPLEHPAFYYSIHRHSIRGMNMPKSVDTWGEEEAAGGVFMMTIIMATVMMMVMTTSPYRLNRFLQYLTEAGFRVSRTHFDPTGVRTDASLLQFKDVLTKYSTPTCTSASNTSSTSTEQGQL